MVDVVNDVEEEDVDEDEEEDEEGAQGFRSS